MSGAAACRLRPFAPAHQTHTHNAAIAFGPTPRFLPRPFGSPRPAGVVSQRRDALGRDSVRKPGALRNLVEHQSVHWFQYVTSGGCVFLKVRETNEMLKSIDIHAHIRLA